MSVADQIKLHIRSMSVPFALMLVVLVLMQISPAYAQTIKVKVLNGSNGHPIANKCMYVWVGNKNDAMSGPLLQTQTDSDGVIKLQLTQEQGITNSDTQLACGLTGTVAPSMRLGDTISVRTGYALCQTGIRDSWLARSNFSTEEVLQHGVVTPNTCGKATVSPTPGEVVLFVRPLTWWEKLKK